MAIDTGIDSQCKCLTGYFAISYTPLICIESCAFSNFVTVTINTVVSCTCTNDTYSLNKYELVNYFIEVNKTEMTSY